MFVRLRFISVMFVRIVVYKMRISRANLGVLGLSLLSARRIVRSRFDVVSDTRICCCQNDTEAHMRANEPRLPIK
jgi:hypothetical protein